MNIVNHDKILLEKLGKALTSSELSFILNAFMVANSNALKEIPDYSHSDFKNLEEYIEYMRRPPISDKETKEVDWDEEFK